MLLDYAEFYEQPAPAPQPFVWMPTRKKRVVIRATMDCELPAMQSEATATVRVVANIDAALHALVAVLEATASTLPPMFVEDVTGSPEEDELLMLMAGLLLIELDEEEDD